MRKSCWVFAVVAAAFAATQALAETDAKTVRLWKAKCASCHGADGKAQTETGAKLGIPDMTAASWQSKVSDAQMKTSISDGVVRPGKSEGMDPYKDKLDAAQIDSLVAYIRTLGKSP